MKSARPKVRSGSRRAYRHEVVEELASQKAIEVASMVRTYEETHQELVTPSDLMVIGADTIVSCGGQILGKPKDERDACRMLKLLSGGTHQVYTGVSIVLLDASGKAGQVTFHEKTDVTMRAMSEEEIRALCRHRQSRWTRRAHTEFRGNVRFLLTKSMATIIML